MGRGMVRGLWPKKGGTLFHEVHSLVSMCAHTLPPHTQASTLANGKYKYADVNIFAPTQAHANANMLTSMCRHTHKQ